jgi:hypothetical protein
MKPEEQAPSKVNGIWVYGVVPTGTKETSSGEGIDRGTPVRTIRENGLAAVVSDAQQGQYDASRANIGAHERVVRETYERGEVLPMRFGMIARDDRAVHRFLRDVHDDLVKSLEALRNRSELSLKVLWERERMLGEILLEDAEIRAQREAIGGQPAEQTHNQRVELGRLVGEAMERKRQSEADGIVERLRAKAIDVDIANLMSEDMVLNAAFLVERDAIAAFDEEIRSLGDEQRGRLNLRYTGPLPPYSFVRIEVPNDVQKEG